MMSLVLKGLNFAICLIYLDDIIVFASDIETHLDRLEQVLIRLEGVNLKLKPSKCHLLQREVMFLGHLVSRHGLGTDPAKISAVQNWPTPTKLKEVRAFLGLCSYYRKFVPDFAQIGRPLHGLTKKETPFHWTEDCVTAFETMKDRLTQAPILALPTDDDTYVLDTDASGHSIGAVLSQIQDGVEKVICYGSRVCSLAEQNYDVTRRELLAIVHFLKTYRSYLLGRRFLLRTDHSALQWLQKTPTPIGQQARWLNVISEFDFEVKHRAGTAHLNADALSRRPHAIQVIKCDTTMTGKTVELPADWSRATIAAEQRDDIDLGCVIQHKSTSEDPPSHETIRDSSGVVKRLVAQWPQLELHGGLLTRRWLHPDETTIRWLQLIPPVSRRATIIQLAHVGMTGGHLGLRRTMKQVQRRAYWPGWAEDVRIKLQRCTPCARYHRGKLAHKGPMQNMVVGDVGEVLSLDLTGPHPATSGGHRYILTFIDHFSRWAEAVPVRNQEAVTVAKALVVHWISRFGCPLQILTDQGSCFEAELFQDLCRLLGIDKVRTSPYKPSTNGMLERFHKTLNAMLAKVVAGSHRDWNEQLPMVLAAYRASIHSGTGFSPNKLFLNRETTMPLDLVLGDCYVRGTAPECHEYVLTQGVQIQDVFTLARETMKKQAKARAYRYNLRARNVEFQIGEYVWYYYDRKPRNQKDKWASHFQGPYRVEKKLSTVLYQIRKTPRSQAKIIFIDKLKLYHGPTPDGWGDPGNASDVEVSTLPEEPADLPIVERPKRVIQKPKRYEDSV
jgi:transposase InsO family protein